MSVCVLLGERERLLHEIQSILFNAKMNLEKKGRPGKFLQVPQVSK